MATINDEPHVHAQAPDLAHTTTGIHHGQDQESHEQKDIPSSPSGDNDEKSSPSETDSGSYHEVERNIGVTKIEALYIVFGKGWKLVMLWL